MNFYWVKIAVTHFVTQFTHVSRLFGVNSIKQRKIFRENCFENVVSDLQKISYVSAKLLLEKSAKTKRKKI